MIEGINVDWNHGISVEDIIDLGANACRFPLWEDTGFDYRSIINECLYNDIEPLPVYDSRALSVPRGRSYDYKLARIAKRYPMLNYIQVTNEPDGTGHSSGRMTQRKYIDILRRARKNLPSSMKIIAGGLCFSIPGWIEKLAKSYLYDFINSVDAIAIHHYGLTPNDEYIYPETGFGSIDDNLNYVSSLFPDKIIWVTEMGGEIGLFDNIDHKSEWLNKSICAYYEEHNKSRIGAIFYFCLLESMVKNHGAIDMDGNKTEIYYTLENWMESHI